MKKMIFKNLALSLLIVMAPISAHAQEECTRTTLVTVDGLVCDFCARALERVFQRQENVETISVDLDQSHVMIVMKDNHQMDESTLNRLIQDSGYNIRHIEYGTCDNEKR